MALIYIHANAAKHGLVKDFIHTMELMAYCDFKSAYFPFKR